MTRAAGNYRLVGFWATEQGLIELARTDDEREAVASVIKFLKLLTRMRCMDRAGAHAFYGRGLATVRSAMLARA